MSTRFYSAFYWGVVLSDITPQVWGCGRHKKRLICEIFSKLVYFVLNFWERVIFVVFVWAPRLHAPSRRRRPAETVLRLTVLCAMKSVLACAHSDPNHKWLWGCRWDVPSHHPVQSARQGSQDEVCFFQSFMSCCLQPVLIVDQVCRLIISHFLIHVRFYRSQDSFA
jgi:hypothetical protein